MKKSMLSSATAAILLGLHHSKYMSRAQRRAHEAVKRRLEDLGPPNPDGVTARRGKRSKRRHGAKMRAAGFVHLDGTGWVSRAGLEFVDGVGWIIPEDDAAMAQEAILESRGIPT